MNREWKPGDVASVLSNGTQVALRTRKGWTYVDGSTNDVHADGYGFRPLVVIDPEDDDAVTRLANALEDNHSDHKYGVHQDWVSVQEALREFASPTPLKPDRPTGLYAVVEDSDGIEWVAIETSPSGYSWQRLGCAATTYAEWDSINAVRVLSEGLQ